MALFGLSQKKEEPQQVVTPVDEVLRMKEQGFTNNQIVQTLQRNGYKTHQIFDAMNQADLRNAGPIEGAVPPEMAQQPQGQQQPQQQDMQMPPSTGQEDQSIPELPQQESYHEQAPSQGYEQQIEEVAEAIIDEKWADLMKDINKILQWKESIENRMAALEQAFKDLKASNNNLQQSIIGKVSEYDKTMKTVGTDMKAMENVFQKILPTLTENVNELSRLTKKTKSKK